MCHDQPSVGALLASSAELPTYAYTACLQASDTLRVRDSAFIKELGLTPIGVCATNTPGKTG
jgi:hypothetical protein